MVKNPPASAGDSFSLYFISGIKSFYLLLFFFFWITISTYGLDFFFSNFSSLWLTTLIGLHQLLNFASSQSYCLFSCRSPNAAPVVLLLGHCEPTGWVLVCISFHGSPRTDTLFPGSCVFLFFYVFIFFLSLLRFTWSVALVTF